MGSLRNLVGEKFGRLQVTERYSQEGKGKVKWLCKCECGGTAIAQSAHLLDGRRVSCGCAKEAGNQIKRKKPIHGHCVNGKNSRVYKIWQGMITRCSNKNNAAYKNYGARGISVCERWKDFELFLNDMGEPIYSQSLDRIDVNGNYEPYNCRWATSAEQARNKRDNHLITFCGVTKTLIEWSEEYDIDKSTLWSRIVKCKWPIEKALKAPLYTKSEAAISGNKIRWGKQ